MKNNLIDVAYIDNQNSRMYCNATQESIGNLYLDRNSIDENPEYQRESAVWSPERKELFIDSLINNFDVPKIYLNDLRPLKQNKDFAIVDGKQRLTTIYDFIDNRFPLAIDFKKSDSSKFGDLKGGTYFKEFHENDRERFKGVKLSLVHIIDANDDDIEDLFFRLNNGEPLNAAEKRNGIKSDMNTVISDVTTHKFFTEKIRFKERRYSFREISAKLILLELTDMNHNEIFSDLKKKYLDYMVTSNRRMTAAEMEGIKTRVFKNLNTLNKVFYDKDPLLNRQTAPSIYYLFVKVIHREYGHAYLSSILKSFLEQFEVNRIQNMSLPEEERDSVLMEYSRLMQQGTNDISNLKLRIATLTRYFLLEHPEVKILDGKRAYTFEERYVIYINSGKKCALCDKKFNDISEMEADHFEQHAFGGETTLKNARSLCVECNQKEKQKIK